jgi:hypothetical protein
MDNNLLLSSNSALLIRKLRKKKLTLKTNLMEKTSIDRTKFHNYKDLNKSFNIKSNDTTKSIFPSLSSIKSKSKYYTKVNSIDSSPKDDDNKQNTKNKIKTKLFNKQKINLKLPEKIENFKKVRNQMLKRENNYFKTENNQKIIFNNIGINYHKTKYNNQKIKKSFDKKDVNSVKDMDRVNDNIKGLSIKNNKTKNGKSEKDNKIEILEEKIDKLINFIKNNETLNLKHKINTLQNDIEMLKKENEKLKSELEEKNEIISSLKNNQNQIIYQNNEIIDKISSNKEKSQKIKNRNYDIDLDKLKLISIDPDDI